MEHNHHHHQESQHITEPVKEKMAGEPIEPSVHQGHKEHTHAVLMSLSTIIVAINAQLLKRVMR